ncbi:MAG TPA: hypothetical protein VIT23_06030 [Terrimicrobiaceae bacterium]
MNYIRLPEMVGYIRKLFLTKWPLFAMIAFVLLVSCTFAYWSIVESFAHGRLASEPNYDDVGYLYRGARALQSIREGYVTQVLASYMHSPFSVLLAATSFAIWGAKDWAPYAGNVVVVVCYLLALCYFLRQLPVGVQMGLLLVFLSLPFATMAVVEFRPDIMWATLVGFATVYISTTDRDFSSRVEAFGIGLVYGAALMAKPSTFLMTTSLIGLGGLLRTLRQAFIGRLKVSSFFVWLMAFLFSALLVAGVYYSLHYERIWMYFYENSFGKNKDIWIANQTLSAHLSHYISSDYAAASNLGRWRLPLLSFVGVSLLLFALRVKETERRLVFASLATVVIAAWLASSLFGMKSPFLGGAFYGILIFASAYLVAEVLKPAPRLLSRPIVQSLTFAGLGILSYTMHTWPAYSEWDFSRASFYRKANSGVWKAIRNVSKRYTPADGMLDVYYSNSSPIPSELPQLRALQSRVPLRMRRGSLANSMEAQRGIFEQCDMIIVQDPNLPEVNPNFPGEKLQMRITQEVLARPGFELAREIVVGDNKRIYVLHNKETLLPKEVDGEGLSPR